MTKYSQRDPQWADIKLGDSTTSTIGRYGCALTCIAMVVNETPDLVNQKLKNAKAFSGDLIYFDKVPLAYPQLKFIERTTIYDNTKALNAIAKNGFCVVEVDFDGIIATVADTHFVVYIGNHLENDPWDGAEKSTASYPPKLLVIYDTVVLPTPPSPAPVITDQTKIPQIVDVNGNPMEVQAIKSQLTDLRNTVSTQNQKLLAVKNIVA